nr:unnamed protein product [Callosobruchus chinensis]
MSLWRASTWPYRDINPAERLKARWQAAGCREHQEPRATTTGATVHFSVVRFALKTLCELRERLRSQIRLPVFRTFGVSFSISVPFLADFAAVGWIEFKIHFYLASNT